MTPERWQRLEDLFHAMLERPPMARAAALSEACRDDVELRAQVERLLDAHAQASSFVSGAAAGVERVAATMVPEGTHIGAYRIVRELGRGGMGTVYLGERADAQFEMRVAIKLIKRGMDTDAVLQRFRHERQILASLEHPNITRLLDGGTTGEGVPYFVMDYVDGQPIDDYCRTHRLSLQQRLHLFRQVCAAVSHAHQHLAVHRDIKPSNILVTSDGVPKLLDFGIAKLLETGENGATMATEFGAQAMTPQYASPEQLRGERITTVSDVYALGMLLYELLAGARPYELSDKSPDEVRRIVADTNIVNPSAMAARRGDETLSRRLRGDIDAIAITAMRKDPAERYGSVALLDDDVRRHMEGRPVVARGDSWTYRTARFVRRRKLGVAAAAAIVITLVGGVIATSWQARVARAERARAERRFSDVRRLSTSFLFEFHDAIATLPGATRARLLVVSKALEYLDSLAVDAGGDPALQRDLAAAYERLGDVRGRPFAANLGHTAGAMESYLKALRIREALVAASPQDVENRRDLARSHVRIANQLIQTNEAVRGTDYLRKALAIYLQLSAELPANTQILYDLADTYNELGTVLEDWWGDSTGALENHRKALVLREQFMAHDPLSQTHRRDLSVTYVNFGRALALSGDIKGALEINRKALATRVALFAENSTNADYRRLLAISYQNDGNYRASLADVSGALQSFRKKLALDEQSLAQDPVNTQTREDLGYSCERIANLLADSGDYVQALSFDRKALVMYEGVSAIAPQILRVRYRVVFARAGIGMGQAKLGMQTAAVAECAKASSLLSEIPADPSITWQRTMRAQLYMQLGRASVALATSKRVPATEQREHWRRARNMYVRALEIWHDMRRRNILRPEDATKPQEVAREIARCDAFIRSN